MAPQTTNPANQSSFVRAPGLKKREPARSQFSVNGGNGGNDPTNTESAWNVPSPCTTRAPPPSIQRGSGGGMMQGRSFLPWDPTGHRGASAAVVCPRARRCGGWGSCGGSGTQGPGAARYGSGHPPASSLFPHIISLRPLASCVTPSTRSWIHSSLLHLGFIKKCLGGIRMEFHGFLLQMFPRIRPRPLNSGDRGAWQWPPPASSGVTVATE